MKLNIKHLPILGALALSAISMGSCTDKIAFGDDFLEKAPGGTVTADTVFGNAEYTRNFLAQAYAYQYYNLPSNSTNSAPQCWNYWKGMPDLLGDTHQACSTTPLIFTAYYNGMLTSMQDSKKNYNVYPYHNEHIWENVRSSYLLIERIDGVPGMDDAEKARIKDEARCLLVSTYFTAFRHYGGLPILKGTFNGNETNYEGRKSAEENIEFMVGMLDEVIAGKHLPWGYTGAAAASETGHWTLAGAMALKIQILQFAASPLLNSDAPYFQGKYQMEHPEFVWLGGYDASRWTKLRQACQDFFQALSANGVYHLVVPAGNTQEDYAYAYRSGYMLQDSPEILHSVRTSSNANGNDYGWYNLGFGNNNNGSGTNTRYSYCPTQEYVEMFPYADGTPFDWDKAEKEGKLDEMFIKGDRVEGKQELQNIKYTRDPRLYESVGTNMTRCVIEWNNGRRSGEPYEAYVGGSVAHNDPKTNTTVWGTGYRNLKYLSGTAFRRQKPQWNPLMLSDMYLTYAEAIIQSGGSCTEALPYIDAVRARVGLKGLAECNPDKNLTSNKDNLLQEILRERACEFSFQTTRYFDMIRYKRADLFERPLHGLRIYRIVDGKRSENQWYAGDRTKAEKGSAAWYEPNHFEYEKFEITTGARIWWTQGFDPKWYFQPFPITEVNKNYGLDQNPGW